MGLEADSKRVMDVAALYRLVGQRIVVRRNGLGMTQAELGARISLSRAAVANIERGHQKLALHQVYLIADALGLTVADLLPDVERPDASASGLVISGAEGLSDATRRQIEQIYRGVEADA